MTNVALTSSLLVGIYLSNSLESHVDFGSFHQTNSFSQIVGIDGNVYFFGLVDTLQKFTVHKWLERKVKRSKVNLKAVWSKTPIQDVETSVNTSIVADVTEISVEEPVRYASRLLEFAGKLFSS